MNLARIRNPHAIVRLLRSNAPVDPLETQPRVWGRLAAPVDPLVTQLRARAQSLLSGPLLGQCPPLTADQARDVIAWHDAHLQRQAARSPRRWTFLTGPNRGSA